jgi:hypothetical protein
MRPARADELTDRAAHDYRVLYPSGQGFAVRGVFIVVALDGEHHIGIRDEAKVVLLDPRAVVARNGLVIHDPRRAASLPGWARAWLDRHPEWPRVATEAVEPCL